MNFLPIEFAFPVAWIGFVLFQGTLILAISLIIWRTLRKSSAATRHLVLLAGLLAIVFGFVLQLAVSNVTKDANIDEKSQAEVEVKIPTRPGNIEIVSSPVNSVGNRILDEPSHNATLVLNDDKSKPSLPGNSNIKVVEDFAPATPALSNPDASYHDGNSRPVDANRSTLSKSRESFLANIAKFLPWLGLVWMIVSALLAFRFLLGVRNLNRLVCKSRLLNDSELPVSLRKIVCRTRVMIGSEANQMPMAFGILSPTILVSSDFLSQSRQDQQSIIVHEMSHIRRRDPIVNMFVQVLLILSWFHPLVFITARYLRHESEHAADDRVIKSGMAPEQYANSLLSIIRKRHVAWRSTSSVAVGMAQGGELTHRLRSIVDKKTARETVTHFAAIVLAVVFASISSGSLLLPINASETVAQLPRNSSSPDSEEEDKSNGPDRVQPTIQDNQTDKFVFRGQVNGPDGKPVPNCLVWLHRSGEDVEPVTCNSKGEFEISTKRDIFFGYLHAATPDEMLQSMVSIHRDNVDEMLDNLIKLKLETVVETKVIVRHNQQPLSNAIVVGLPRITHPIVRIRTDEAGTAILRTPNSFPLESIWAFDEQNGVAFWYPAVRADSVDKARENQPAEITLDLLPKRTCTVKVIDETGQPVPNFEIFPYFRIEEDSNRKYFPNFPENHSKTNEQGIATFDWMPAEPANWFIPDAVDKNYLPLRSGGRSTLDLRKPDQVLIVKRRPTRISIRGNLLADNAEDLAGVKIIGHGVTNDGDFAPRFSAVSDENGQFSGDIVVDSQYYFIATHPNWASGVLHKVFPKTNTDSDITLTLYPATQVTAKVTRGTNRIPVTRGDIIVAKEIDVAIKSETGKVRNMVVSLRDYVRMDSQGAILVGLGRGKWSFLARSGKWSQKKEMNISDDAPESIEFHGDWFGENEIMGSVQYPEDLQPKLSALDKKVAVTIIDHRYRGEKFATTVDDQGNWKLSADVQSNFLAIAYSQNKKLGGIQFVSAPGDLPAKIKLTPTATVRGVLVDEAGDPIPNMQLVQFYEHGRQDRVDYALAVTDSEGHFEMNGVLPGIRQKLAIRNSPGSFTFVGGLTKYQPGEERENVKAVWVDYKARESERLMAKPKPIDLDSDLKRLAQTVKLANMRGLVLVHGGAQSANLLAQNVLNLDDEKKDIDREIIHYLPRSYDATRLKTNAPSMTAIAKYGIAVPEKDEVVIGVIDGDGKMLGTTKLSNLIDLDSAREFLRAHLPTQRNARKLYEAAQADAKRDEKNVWLMLGGPRCGPCFSLNAWYESQRSILEKDYVLFKFHPLRCEQGIDLAKEIRIDNGGIPWFVIQDPAGTSLTTSDGPNGNIGFPGSEPSSVDHLIDMIEKTRKNITDDELNIIRQSLMSPNKAPSK